MNPLVPTALDGVLMTVSVVALLVALAAFLSLIQSSSTSGRRLLAWTVVVLFIPIMGPATWFAARQRERSIEPNDDGFGS
ncbi:PLDc N-terminal domain-containing protein [Curtobacterium sp. ISL-83]|uniref:PLDc N-terminal domain-containing protein n=1 Tax=Curtobacterium sp. ISL-83 TaxID=2819145 RepID=UPI001BEC18C0|nr:PLDc N-terminal domain-containing protein [Curtobacterium sp. ISL-83]MBT2503783.1 PLDc N-terminal domain-containing protein [Curtobacterium sp. ISL-83]